MKKIKSISLILLLLIFSTAALFQYEAYQQSINSKSEQAWFKKVDVFLNETNDIEKLRGISLELLKSKEAYYNHLTDLYINARNIALALSFFPCMLVFYSFRMNQNILTIKSTQTKNP